MQGEENIGVGLGDRAKKGDTAMCGRRLRWDDDELYVD